MNYNLAENTRNRYLGLINTTKEVNGVDYYVYDVLITPTEESIEIYKKDFLESIEYKKAIYRFIESNNLELRLWARNEDTKGMEIISFEYREYD